MIEKILFEQDVTMRQKCLALLSIAALMVGCGQAGALNPDQLIVVDTHIDLPYRLNRNYENVGQLTEHGDFDYARARRGGLSAAFMSIFVPVEKQSAGLAKDFADHLIDLVESTSSRNADKFEIARSTRDIARIARTNRIALSLGMENGAAIENDLLNVWHFYNRGIRYITLAHGKSNQISDSSYDPNRQWGGLSPFGVKVVQEMNRLGIIVDVSHITDEALLDVLEVSETPVLATHSSARSFTPGFERNLSDELIGKIADNGGVVQVNFGSAFLTQAANEWYLQYYTEETAYRSEHELGQYEPVPEFEEAYRTANPPPYATLDDVLDHIDHIVNLAGIDHVGFGSDFDGVGDSLPIGLKSVADYPALIEGLRERGYGEDDVLKIAGRNTLRVWAAAEEHAKIQRLLALHETDSGWYRGRYK